VHRPWVFLVPLALAAATGCGGEHQASPSGLRIYDPSGHVPGQVIASEVVASSVRTGPEGGRTTHGYFIYFDLTSQGKKHIHTLTAGLARRGRQLHHFQHFVFEVGGHVYGRPFIDYRAFPDGIDGSSGIEIPGVAPKVAKRVARELQEGGS
jgi:hypothetical protein